MSIIKEQKTYYPQLTGIRALAAYLIFLHHYPHALGSAMKSICAELHIGVPIFFLLSGFLIYLRYSETCRLEKQWLSSYFKNRFAKIYPVYFFAILLQYYATNGTWFDIFMQASFIRGFSDEYKFMGVAPGWSLTVEETFYVLFPFLLFFIHRIGFLFSLLAMYGVGSILLKGGSLLNWHSFFMPDRFVSYYTFFGQASHFFMGMFLAKYILKLNQSIEPPKLKKKMIGYLTYLGLFSLLLCVFGFFSLRKGGIGLFASPFGLVINHIFLPFCIALFFLGLIKEKTFIRQFLQTKLMVLLGKSSYIFYLIHVSILSSWICLYVSRKILVMFILLNILAVAFYFIIEVPCQKFIKNFKWKRIDFRKIIHFKLPRELGNKSLTK